MPPELKTGIYPCLWFDTNARESADFYSGVFSDCSVLSDNGMVVIMQIRGSKFMLLNGGPHYKLNEATSWVIECDTQAEIDYYWEQFKQGGEEQMCGWIKDKFGVSWQVIPSVLGSLMSEPERARRVIQAFMQMKKFDIQTILDA